MNKLFVTAAGLLFSTLVHAETTFRDWKFNLEADALLGTQVCRAYTTVSNNVPFPVELSLSFPVAFDHPPTMVLKMPAASGVQRAYIPFSAREVEDLLIFQVAGAPTDKDLLWYVPLQMEKMVDIIIGNSNLPLKFSLPNKEVVGSLSLTGSTAAMNQIARCLRQNDPLPSKFFRELNTAAGTATLGPDQTVQQLMTYVDQAYGNFQGMVRSEADLKKLRDTMKTLLQQETVAQSAFNVAQEKLDRATLAAAQTAEKIRLGQERLALIPGEIQQLQNQKGPAEAAYIQKKSVYDQLKAASQPLRDAIAGAEERVRRAQSAIRSRENTIANGQQEIRDLQAEASRLNNKIRDLEREIQPLERKKSELETDLATYSIEIEKRKILDNNWSYKIAKDSAERLRREERQKHGDLQFANGRLQRAEQNLRQCLSGPNPQCAAEQTERDTAANDVSRLQSEVNSIRSQIQSHESTMDRYERDAENEAIRGREAIVTQLRRVAGDLADKRSERDRAENRVDDIQRSHIPALQAEISRCQTELPGLRRDLATAQTDLSAANTNFANWKSSNGYDRIETEYLAAKRALDDIVSGITQKQNEQAQITRAIPGWRTTLTQQQAEVTRLTPPRDSAKTKLDGIQAQLTPARAQEKALVDGLAAMKIQYDENRKLYQTLAEVLLGP